MARSSRSPTKLSHVTHRLPSGDAAMLGQSSWRYSCPTAVALIWPNAVRALRASRNAVRSITVEHLIRRLLSRVQPTIHLEPFFQTVHKMVGAAAFLPEAVAAGLEDMQFHWDIGLAPGAEEVQRTLVSHRLVVGRNRDEHRRRAVGRCGLAGVRGIDRRSKVGPGIRGTGDRRQ